MESIIKMSVGSKKWCIKSGFSSKPPQLLVWLWPLLDKIISRRLRIKPLRGDERGIIGIELRRYRGESIQLDDGTIIVPGDLLVELHLNGIWFLRNRHTAVDSTKEQVWKVSSAVVEDLRYLAKQIVEGNSNNELKALRGLTLLHLPARRLGFHVRELPQSLRKCLTTFYLSGLRRVYHSGERTAELRTLPTLKEVWMSKSRLLELYFHQ